jgi:hypothetical protein
LLAARFGDLVEMGVTREDRAAFRLYAEDSEIKRFQNMLHERLVGDATAHPTSPRRFIVQGINLERAEVGTSAEGNPQVDFKGEMGELLSMQAYLLVRAVGADRLLVCDCGHVFVREGKRQFCSERCQKRVYMRRFRAGEAGKE